MGIRRCLGYVPANAHRSAARPCDRAARLSRSSLKGSRLSLRERVVGNAARYVPTVVAVAAPEASPKVDVKVTDADGVGGVYPLRGSCWGGWRVYWPWGGVPKAVWEFVTSD